MHQAPGAVEHTGRKLGFTSDNVRPLCIASKEMIPIVVAAAIFGKQWSQKVIQFRVDNMAVVQVINATFCSENHPMHLVRLLVFFATSGFTPLTSRGMLTLWLMHYHVITSIFSSHRFLQSPFSQQ